MESYLDEKYLVTRKKAKHNFRKNIFEAWNYSCAYCGSPANTLDHIHPKSKGGLNLTHNLVSCCLHCNLSKGSQDFHKWYIEQEFYSAAKEAKLIYWNQNLFSIGAEGSECKTS